MSRYIIAAPDEQSNGFYINFFRRVVRGIVIETRIAPTVYPNRKKAKRVLKRLNRHHGGDFFLINYDELLKDRAKKCEGEVG